MEKNEVLIYITEDGTVKLEVTMEAETVWLNLNQLCELFQRDKSVISRHIKNIYTEGELEESSTVAFFATVQNEGGRSIERKIAYYNLSREELEILDRLVSAYLDIAELRAMNREPMYMKDWLETIDDYLKMTRRDILTHKGKVSHRQALEKAHKEYEKYSEKAKQYLSSVEKHYLEAVSTLEGIEKKQE